MWLKTKIKLIFDPYNITTKHDKQKSWKKVVIGSINDDMDLYYAWFIQRRYFPSAISSLMERPLRGPHFTLVNDKITDKLKLKNYNKVKNKWHNKYINVEYNTDARTDGEYWWLKCKSKEADSIRNELQIGKPYFNYHITIGIVQKPSMLIHSRYIHKLIRNNYEEKK